MLKAGDAAPSFKLAANGGRSFDSDSLMGRRYLLYFYPKDNTPGCTREACGFRDAMPGFDKLGVPVFGVSADKVPAHDRFALKHGLNFPLLADPDHELIEAYGVWVEKSLYGRKYFGVARSTFLVGADGKIEMAWEKVSPDSHAAEVREYLAGIVPKAKAAKKAAAR
jgi:peroxiredoxin Q/BCP